VDVKWKSRAESAEGTFGDPCQKMLAEGVFGLFNCGTGQGRTWLDLARAVFAAMGREPRIRFIEMPEDLRPRYQYRTVANIRTLRTAGYGGCIQSVGGGRSRLRPIVSGADGGTNESRSGRHALTFAPGLTRLDFTTQTITIG